MVDNPRTRASHHRGQARRGAAARALSAHLAPRRGRCRSPCPRRARQVLSEPCINAALRRTMTEEDGGERRDRGSSAPAGELAVDRARAGFLARTSAAPGRPRAGQVDARRRLRLAACRARRWRARAARRPRASAPGPQPPRARDRAPGGGLLHPRLRRHPRRRRRRARLAAQPARRARPRQVRRRRRRRGRADQSPRRRPRPAPPAGASPGAVDAVGSRPQLARSDGRVR